MKRAGGLWNELTSFGNFLFAAGRAAAGKRTRADVAGFLLNLEGNILELQRELIDETYLPGEYRTFQLTDPKPRMISAAPFRDRVVHHALTQVLEPVFEPRFSSDSFACRTGFGTHRALERAKRGVREFPFVLKCDIRKYFASMDHAVLKELLARAIKCKPTLRLAAKVIDGSNPQEEILAYFPGDNLFFPLERRRGLPLGNQTSQFFANLYLNPLDQMVNRELRPGLYVRYVDDFLLFGRSKSDLHFMRDAVVSALATLRLTMHPRKSRVYRTTEGVTFLGWRIFPEKSRLVRGNLVRFRRRMRTFENGYALGDLEWDDITQRVRSWIAHADHGDTWRLREQMFRQFAFRRGSAV